MKETPQKYDDRLSSLTYSMRQEQRYISSRYSDRYSRYSDRCSRYSDSHSHYSDRHSRYSDRYSRYSDSCYRYSDSHSHYSDRYSRYSDRFSDRYSDRYYHRPLSMPKRPLSMPKIDIDMRLTIHILLNEVRKGFSCQNVVCSPLSLEFALQMVAAGSKGETLLQIMQFIGFKGNQLDSMEDLNLKSSSIMRVASSYCKKRKRKECYDEKEPDLSFANGVWVDQFYPLKPSYKELMRSIYNAKAEIVNFKKQANQLTGDINSWVADKTKGLIEQIVAPGSISRDTILILVNALYFKGHWNSNSEFDQGMTEDRDFYMLDGSKISVPFMTRRSPKNLYRAFDGFSILQLDYQSGDDKRRQFCMQILLPDERDGLQNLMNKCVSDPGFLNQDFGLKTERFEELRVPKFKFTYSPNDLVSMMKSLGLTLPFNEHCKDLTEMVELTHGCNLRISNIFHKATIEVNESNTEASAVTYIEGTPGRARRRSPSPPTLRFVADHPFMFVIKEVNSGAIFFIGAVLNPLLKD